MDSQSSSLQCRDLRGRSRIHALQAGRPQTSHSKSSSVVPNKISPNYFSRASQEFRIIQEPVQMPTTRLFRPRVSNSVSNFYFQIKSTYIQRWTPNSCRSSSTLSAGKLLRTCLRSLLIFALMTTTQPTVMTWPRDKNDSELTWKSSTSGLKLPALSCPLALLRANLIWTFRP